MLKFLSKVFKDRVDIIVMPSKLNTVKIRVRLITVVIIFFLWILSIIGACYVLIRSYDYSLTRADNQIMKAKLAIIGEELERGRKYLELTQTTERQMRQMLGMPVGKNNPTPGSEEEKLLFSKVFARGSGDILEEDYKEYIDNIENLAKQRLANFQEIAWYYANKKSNINATPSIRPSNGRITSGFGYRLSPFGAPTGAMHKGLDFADKPDSPIVVTADGVVRHTGWASGFGQAVLVDHGYGYSTLYGHVTGIIVKAGDVVKRGDKIATMGTTGRSTGVHLHYEVWLDGNPVNPRKYFD
ncbi:metalloendopeptidase-like membrane protein [Elusimicrobium minutum Pei191]|uniref:Metalloendopeptidase-like membrane protein n=1 Tax=Elusimicrobium minutum (strain Pei191) TaxID=445932 RepID=B2KBQ4_ELUMP|nr:M23 family metallopeptidase [Elusimicrobium minutum]ACC97741.1 metalloendopeptidase-like membrane protein [Elusimicrobium minutum Pei191]